MHGEARIVAPGPHDGVALADPVEGEVTFKARGLESGGALCVSERELAPGAAVPSHVHDGQEEALYVLAGQLRVRLGERTYPCAAGGFLLIPRGTPHAIENACDAPARVLAVLAPASA
jgi:quercetin dioxygenase-like cupin family protein